MRRPGLPEWLGWLAVPVLVLACFPGYLMLASQVAAAALFVLSLDLLVGHAGVLSLGHALFFGLGAYTAGLLSAAGWGEPVSGLLAATGVAALAGALTAPAVTRVRHLSQLMVTLALALLVHEWAARWRGLTGGDDGLHGIDTWPLLGLFAFDLDGRVAFLYAYGVLALGFWLFCRVLASPFGLGLRGLREQPARMAALGAPVRARLGLAYVMAAALAGAAGAVLAQTTQFVGLDALGLSQSVDALVMLLLGGAGYRYGGMVGATVFIVARDRMAEIDPALWQLGLGLLVMAVVLGAPGGLLGLARRAVRPWRRLRGGRR